MAIATSNFYGRMKPGTVGEPYPEIGLRLDPDTGEIQVDHPGVFRGYWNNPEKTEEAFTSDGWLHTGDVGEWIDGTHIRIVDRIKNIIITSAARTFPPRRSRTASRPLPTSRRRW